MSIILIRHGETAFNVARILQPPDTPLSERGQRQAIALSQRFANMKIGALVSSDLARAMETARAISDVTGAAIRSSALLQERNFGELRGLSYDGLDYDPIAMEDAPPGGESMTTLRDRAMQAMAFLREVSAASDSDVLVVSHGFFIRTLLNEQVQMPQGMLAPKRIDNTSITLISRNAPHVASLVNNVDHLSDDLRDAMHSVSGV